MADYFCDPGAYPAYAAIPSGTFGANAQEGDGKATGLATPAVASFLINAVAAAGNTMAIAGVTLTAVASGATAAQFNVGASTTAQADNIATAINAATATVGATVATGTPQLRNLMYARGPSSGAPANTVEIMTRCGSSDFNHAGNFNMALASAGWSSAPTLTQFAGGASGVWGYLHNMSTIWPSGVAAGGYGVYKSGSNAQPLHGPATLSLFADQVFVSCNGQTLTTPSNPQYTINRDGLNLVYEDGSGAVAAWASRSGVLTYKIVAVGANQVYRKATGAIRVAERSMTYGRFVIEVDTGLTAGNSTGIFNADAIGAESYAENIRVILSNVSNGASQIVYSMINGGKLSAVNCRVEYPNNLIPNFFSTNSSSGLEMTLEGCDFSWSGSPPTPTTPLLVVNSGVSDSKFVLRNCRAIGLPSAIKLFGATTPTQASTLLFLADSCEGFDVPATLIGFAAVGKTKPSDMQSMMLYNMGAKRGTTYETPEGYVQWWDGQDFPTYSAMLPDGSAWALRFRWLSSLTAAISPARPFVIWRSSKTVVSASKQTVKFEMLVDPTYASEISKSHIGLTVGYISNVTSGRKVANSFEQTTANALASSAVSWSLGATYNGYTKVAVSVTLPDAIKQDTEIEYTITARLPAPTADQYVFIDPEVSLS